MEIDEIERRIAENEMSAAQVFTQMRQHIRPSYVPDRMSLHDVGNYTIPCTQAERLKFQQGWNCCIEQVIKQN